MKSEKLKGENEEKGEEKGKKTSEMEHKSDINLNINLFLQKVWSFQNKAAALQQQFPPLLLTMRTTAGLRHL